MTEQTARAAAEEALRQAGFKPYTLHDHWYHTAGSADGEVLCHDHDVEFFPPDPTDEGGVNLLFRLVWGDMGLVPAYLAAPTLAARVEQLRQELAWTLEVVQIGGHFCEDGCQHCKDLAQAQVVLDGTAPPEPVYTAAEIRKAFAECTEHHECCAFEGLLARLQQAPGVTP